MTISEYQKDPIHEKIRQLEAHLKSKFPQYVRTSGYREGAKTKSGNVSRHAKGEAIDVRFDPQIRDYLWSNKEGITVLNTLGLGMLDESTESVMKKTGATGKHLHIGFDNTLVPKARQRYKELTGKDFTEDVQFDFNKNDVKSANSNYAGLQHTRTGVNLPNYVETEVKSESNNKSEKITLAERNLLDKQEELRKLQEQYVNQKRETTAKEQVPQIKFEPIPNTLDTFEQVSQLVDSDNVMQEGGKIPVNKEGVHFSKGKPVIVPSPNITMKNVDYPILGKSLETGEEKIMLPELDYYFSDTKNVYELPLKQKGGKTTETDSQSFTDYPEGATSNAKKALKWAKDNGWGSCGTPVGKQRANQLAKRKPISLETVKRMAAFRRHQQHKDVPYSEGCGGLMWDAWGGDSGIRWAETKVRKFQSGGFIPEEDSFTSKYGLGNSETMNMYGQNVNSINQDVNSEGNTEEEQELLDRVSTPAVDNFDADAMIARMKVNNKDLQKKVEQERGEVVQDVTSVVKKEEKTALKPVQKTKSSKSKEKVETNIQRIGYDDKLKLEEPKAVDTDAILDLQKKLVEEGYNLNPQGNFINNGLDGKLGKVTRQALNDYNSSLAKNGVKPVTYTPVKQGEGLLGDCTESQCSEYVQNELFRNLGSGMNRGEWNKKLGIKGDAWTIGKNIIENGGREVTGDTLKEGDVVTMFTGGSSEYQSQADKEGTGTTHTGLVDKINDDGSYYILHNVHQGNPEYDPRKPESEDNKKFIGKEYRELVKDDVLQGNHYGFQVKNKFRPAYEKVEDKTPAVVERSVEVVSDNENIKPFSEVINDQNFKTNLVKREGIEEQEFYDIFKASLGIIGQETKYGESPMYKTGIKKTGARLSKFTANILPKSLENSIEDSLEKDIFKNDEVSLGAGSMKLATNFNMADIGMYGVGFDNIAEPDKAVKATMVKLARDYKNLLKKGFDKKEALYRAIQVYNGGLNTVTAGKKREEWAQDYDLDYPNKVLDYARQIKLKGNDVEYETLTDDLSKEVSEKSKDRYYRNLSEEDKKVEIDFREFLNKI